MLCLALLFSAGIICAQPLKAFSLTLHYDSLPYLSLKNKKVYSASGAEAVKTDVDLSLVVTRDDSKSTWEWYNLKMDNEKVPENLTGSRTGIVAVSFDREQFDKCKTAADLDRMTGHMTANSFSHFAVIGSNGQISNPCFLARMESGKKALIYVTVINGMRCGITVKLQE